MHTVFRIALVASVFGMVGPPIGGLVAWGMMGAPSLRSPLPFIAGSYGEGAVLAILTGIATCIAAKAIQRDGWHVPAVSALLVGLAWITLGAITDPARPEIVPAMLRTSKVLVPPAIVAAAVCWALAQWLLRRLENSGARCGPD